jgi:copper chaperone CopZ
MVLAMSGISAFAAEATVTNVHNCCRACTQGIEKAIAGAGGKAKVEKTTVTVTAADDAAVKKALEALVAAGYFGEGVPVPAAASDVKAKSVTLEDLHLCCGKCVEGFNKAVKAVPGVTKTDAVKNAKRVVVEGDISPKQVMDALHKAGFHATVK